MLRDSEAKPVTLSENNAELFNRIKIIQNPGTILITSSYLLDEENTIQITKIVSMPVFKSRLPTVVNYTPFLAEGGKKV